MNLKRLSLAVCVLMMLSAAAFAAKKDTLVVGMPSDAKTLDPQMNTDVPSRARIIHLYDALLGFDEDKNVAPALAEKWEQLDSQTYRLTLRKGVKFHNGDELTSEDAVYTLHRMTTPQASAIKAYGSNIDPNGLKIIDRYTFEVKATTPMAGFLGVIAHPSSSIVCKKVVEAEGKDYGKHPIGTGPFKFVKAVKGDYITMERFDDYWGDKPEYKALTMRTIPETNSRVIEAETGNIDIAYQVPNSAVKRIKEEGKVDLYNRPGSSMTYLCFNVQKPPFNDPIVRKAITLAIDREAALDVVYKGLGYVPTIPLLPWMSYCPEKKGAVEYDPDKALDMLKKAGYKDFSFTLYVNDVTDRKNYAELIQGMLADVGIKVDIQVYEWGHYLDQQRKGALGAFIMGWAPNNADPNPGMPLRNCMYTGAGSNRAKMKNPEVDALIAKIGVTQDGPERRALLDQYINMINDLNPWCYLAVQDIIYITRKGMKGVDNFKDTFGNRLNKVTFE